MNFKQNVNKVSVVLSLMLLSASLITLILIARVLWNYRISKKSISEKYSELTAELKDSRDFAIVYLKMITLIRWLATISTLIFVRNYSGIQILMLLIFSIMN
jgi:hypothetical protein